MKAEDISLGQEVEIKGVRSNINGRYRQCGRVMSVDISSRSATVETPNGNIHHCSINSLVSRTVVEDGVAESETERINI